MKQLDMSSPEYLEMIEIRERMKAAAISHGFYDDDKETSKNVQEEMSFLAPFWFSLLSRQYVYQWRIEKNPYYIDVLMMGCKQLDIVPPPALLAVMAETASARVDGDPSGTADKVLNDNFRGQALRLMLNLIYAGDNLTTAASKAAQWHATAHPDAKQLKAGTLERYYSEHFRKTGEQQYYFDAWDRQIERREREGLPKYWQKVREVLPLANDELTGNRRQ